MPDLIPYLSFDGTCLEAMEFYERVLNGKLQFVMKMKEMPGGEQLPPGSEERVVNASLTFSGRLLMAGDTPIGMPFDGMKGICLNLQYDTAEEAKTIFDTFADGGTIQMPFAPTFWAKGFGMVTDRFGTPWMLNGGMIMSS